MLRQPYLVRRLQRLRAEFVGAVPPSELDMLQGDAQPGHCMCCERLLTGTQRLMCTDAECLRLYQLLYQRDRRGLHKHYRRAYERSAGGPA